MLLISLFIACVGSDPVAPPPIAPPAEAVVPPVDPHAGAHASSGGHMAAMAATRDRLRGELGAAYDQPVPGLDTADATRGRELYGQHCASCHGPSGKGDGPGAAGLNPPPADFTDAFHARYYADAGRVRIIEKGAPDTAMVAFEGQLDHQQILDVYAYVRSLRGDAPAAPAEHDHGAHEH